MNQDTQKLIELIESWEKGYLPPSAQIVLRDSKNMIISKDQEIAELSILVKELEEIIEELKSEKTAPQEDAPSEEPAEEKVQQISASKKAGKNAAK